MIPMEDNLAKANKSAFWFSNLSPEATSPTIRKKYIRLFVSVLFVIAKLWKPPNDQAYVEEVGDNMWKGMRLLWEYF